MKDLQYGGAFVFAKYVPIENAELIAANRLLAFYQVIS